MWLRTTMIAGRRVIAFDGKTLRGARDAAGNLVPRTPDMESVFDQ